jgi:hypothetical protein
MLAFPSVEPKNSEISLILNLFTNSSQICGLEKNIVRLKVYFLEKHFIRIHADQFRGKIRSGVEISGVFGKTSRLRISQLAFFIQCRGSESGRFIPDPDTNQTLKLEQVEQLHM